MSTRTYKVQTWDDHGALKNHYLVEIGSPAELRHLTKFLRQTAAHVVIAPVAKEKQATKKATSRK
jgi:hypothetical protein